MSDLTDFWAHTVSVVTVAGSGGMGDIYAAPVTLDCFIDDKRKLVRAAGGAEVVSETTIYAPAGTTILEGSLVTLPGGRVATVLTVAVRSSGILELPDHVEASLT